MPISINSSLATQRLQSLYAQNSATSAKTAESSPFSDMLNGLLEQTASAEDDAQRQAASLLTGESDSIHSVVLASEKAEVALQLTLQIRNKVLDAYNEVMRMQI